MQYSSIAALSGLLTACSEKSCCILQKFIHFTQTTIFFFQCLDPLFQMLILFGNVQCFFRAAFVAADVQLGCFHLLYPAVQRVDRDLQLLCCCFYRTYLFASFTACTLYSFSYCLFSDTPFSSIFFFFYFIPLRLGCQVLLYYISLDIKKHLTFCIKG